MSEAAKPDLVYSRDGEWYQYDNLGELIDSLVSDTDNLVGCTYWVAERQDQSASDYFSSMADHVIEQAQACADDEAGEFAEGFANDVTDEAKAELQALINTWADKHVSVDFWLVENTQELKLTAEDLKEAKADDIAENVDYLAG